jgi:hypothetical protein
MIKHQMGRLGGLRHNGSAEAAVRQHQFTKGITADEDESGFYGLPTRTHLESETTEP